jgi:NitT/TauT family transport system substrate-binding protein
MKHFLAISAVSLTVLAANGPARATDSPALEKKNITIAVGGSISQMNKVAYFVALNRKYFEQEGLTVESNAFASGTAALQSIVGGSADVAESAYEHTLRMQTKGVNMTCLVPYGRYPGNVLVVRKSEADKIKTVADLKGKKIGDSRSEVGWVISSRGDPKERPNPKKPTMLCKAAVPDANALDSTVKPSCSKYLRFSATK